LFEKVDPPLPLTSAEPPKFHPRKGVSVQSADAVRGAAADAAAKIDAVTSHLRTDMKHSSLKVTARSGASDVPYLTVTRTT
jgi:hypothetical protein